MSKSLQRTRIAAMRIACLLPLLLALAAPASAQAVWGTPVTLSAAGLNGSNPQVALDRKGDPVFVWQGPDATTECFDDIGNPSGCIRVQTRVGSAKGAVSAIQTLSAPDQHAYSPQVAVDPKGDAVFVWLSVDHTTDCGGNACARVETRARSAKGVLSPIQTLSAAPQDVVLGIFGRFGSFHVGVDSDGNAVFVWLRRIPGCPFCYVAETRARSAAGDLSAVQTLSAPGEKSQGATVAVDEDGDATFMWSRGNAIETRSRSAAGTLSAIQTLALSGEGTPGGSLAVDSDGNAVFAWSLQDGTTDCDGHGCDRVQTRARSAAGTLSAIQNLSDRSQSPTSPGGPAVDSDGNVVFVWSLNDGTTDCVREFGHGCYRVQTRARSAAGTLSAVQTLSDPGQDAYEGGVGLDSDGNAVFVWQRPDGTTQCSPFFGQHGCRRVQARTRSSAGVLGAVETLSAPGQAANEPEVAVDRKGDAVAAWTSFGETDTRAQAAFGP